MFDNIFFSESAVQLLIFSFASVIGINIVMKIIGKALDLYIKIKKIDQ